MILYLHPPKQPRRFLSRARPPALGIAIAGMWALEELKISY